MRGYVGMLAVATGAMSLGILAFVLTERAPEAKRLQNKSDRDHQVFDYGQVSSTDRAKADISGREASEAREQVSHFVVSASGLALLGLGLGAVGIGRRPRSLAAVGMVANAASLAGAGLVIATNPWIF